MLPEPTPERTGILVLCDLRDPDAWARAGADREAWGRGLADVHPMGLNHVLIVFRPGGAGALEAAS